MPNEAYANNKHVCLISSCTQTPITRAIAIAKLLLFSVQYIFFCFLRRNAFSSSLSLFVFFFYYLSSSRLTNVSCFATVWCFSGTNSTIGITNVSGLYCDLWPSLLVRVVTQNDAMFGHATSNQLIPMFVARCIVLIYCCPGHWSFVRFFFLSKWQPANVFVHLYPIGCHLDILLRSTFSSFPMPNANPDNKLSCVDPIVSALFITLYFSVFVLSAIATTKWHMIMECVSFIHIRICLISISGGNFALETHWNDETQLKLRFSRIDRFLLCILMLSTRQQRFSRPHCLRTTYIYI